jgi:TolA-binding protein
MASGSALLLAASPAEEKDFASAYRTWNFGFLDQAEKEFAEFVRKYPNSEHQNEAILNQAKLRLDPQSKAPQDFSAVVDLLSRNLNQAGSLTDQYRYWIGKAHFESSNYLAAAESFALLRTNHPESPLVLSAIYGEALAKYKLGDLARVIESLRDPSGGFQRGAQTKPNDEVAVKGLLLLAEALFVQKDYKAAEEILNSFENRPLSADQKWKKDYLLAQLQLGNQRPEAALPVATNLFSLALTASSKAESWALLAEVYRNLNQTAAAISAYTNNLADTTPPVHQQQALLKIVELSLSSGNLNKAIKWLDDLIPRQPQPALLDLVRFTLSELRLKQYYQSLGTPLQTNTIGMTSTNFLNLARSQLNLLITSSPEGPLLGKAHLNRGWCYWEEGKFAESASDFKMACDKLPFSDEQAVARFKWADSQFQQRDYAGAIQNYLSLVTQYDTFAPVKDALIGRALYQIVLASIEVDDQINAANALRKILETFPDSDFAERGVLLADQVFKQHRTPADVRAIFQQFREKFPQSSLVPEAQLAIARSYVQEDNWTEAIRHYDAWTKEFTNHEALAAVELDRAWVYDRAGNETNAFILFTNFVARFPSHPEAPLVQNWVAEFYWQQGQYDKAEENFQKLYQNTNFPPSELTYRARYKAGAVALQRYAYDNAIEYFNGLINDTTCPPGVAAETYFALGDAFTLRPPKGSTNGFDEAINAFSAIQQNFPTNRLVPIALGRIADCHLQLGASDPTRYDRALTNYQEVLKPKWPKVPVSVRSQAEIGCGLVLEKQAELRPAQKPQLLREALDHYLKVFSGRNLQEGEQAEEFWVNKAGNEVARLASSLQQWSQAINVLNYLMNRFDRFPVLRADLAKKIEKAKERMLKE